MSYPAFSDEWAAEWRNQINQNDAYRNAASGWTWPLVLTMRDDTRGERTSVYVDLKNGECLEARSASNEDIKKAPFMVNADISTWKKILSGEMEVITGIMWGKLTLEKGDLGTLAKYVSAAKQLVVSAAHIDTVFPEEA